MGVRGGKTRPAYRQALRQLLRVERFALIAHDAAAATAQA
jgi:hypothetical protein